MSRYTRRYFLCDKCKKERASHAEGWEKAPLPPEWVQVGPFDLCPQCLERMREEWLYAPPVEL